MRALKAQGIDRNTLPYKAPFQPYASWFALIFTGIVLFFNGAYCFSTLRQKVLNTVNRLQRFHAVRIVFLHHVSGRRLHYDH